MDYQQKQGNENQGQDAAKKEDAKVTWKCPTQSNVVTSPFGPRNVKGGSNPHKGIDLRAQAGASYYAAADGKVTRAGGGDYNTIVIDHGGGIQTRYLHASAVSAKLGDVKAGDRLAAAGGKGPKGVNHYAYHLHFDVIKNGTRIDPEAFLQSQGVSLVRKGGKGDVENGTTGDNAGKNNSNAAKNSGNTANNNGATAKTDPELNAEGHPAYFKKGAQDTNSAISWNKNQKYTTAYIKSVQQLIKTDDDGSFGTNTVNAIRHYKEKNGLSKIDGLWDKECADCSGLAQQYKSSGSSKVYGVTNDTSSLANHGHLEAQDDYDEAKHRKSYVGTNKDYVHNGSESSAQGQKVIDFARNFIGLPYVWAGKGEVLNKSSVNSLIKYHGKEKSKAHGTWEKYYETLLPTWEGKRGFDCSGLCVYSYKECGTYIGQWQPSSRGSNEMDPVLTTWYYGGKPDQKWLKVGDVIRTSGHYLMYTGNGKVIEATEPYIQEKRDYANLNVLAVYRYFND